MSTQEPGISLRQARELLEQINEVRLDGTRVSELPLVENYSVWQLFQQDLLYRHIRTLGRPRRKVGWLAAFGQTLSKSAIVLVSALGALYFLIRRPRVLIYTVDRVSSRSDRCDFRLEAIYAFLAKHRIPYFEIVHTSPGTTWLKNFARRRRPVLYLEALDYLHSSIPHRKEQTLSRLSGDHLPEDIREPALELVARQLRRIPTIRFLVSALGRLLAMGRVEVLLSIDDPRHYGAPILACRANGIPTYAFQHGHFTRYHVGWVKVCQIGGLQEVVPDCLVVWSDYWKDELQRLGSVFDPNQVKAGGKPYGERLVPSTKSTAPPADLTVCVPYENEADKPVVAQFIRRLLTLKDTKVLFKVRPDQPESKQLREYGLSEVAGLDAVLDLNSVGRPDLAVGSYSTLLYQMVERGIPVAVLETGMDMGAGMVENGLAFSLNPHTFTLEELSRIARQDPTVSAKKTRRLVGTHPPDINAFLAKIVLPDTGALKGLAGQRPLA